jgi:hypothetical protein
MKQEEKTPNRSYNGTTILLDMTQLDTSVSQIGRIRDKVSFILNKYNSQLESLSSSSSLSSSQVEICVLLESPGGSAADYALAAQQILRLRNHPNITVTILVDKVAASGKLWFLFEKSMYGKQCIIISHMSLSKNTLS